MTYLPFVSDVFNAYTSLQFLTSEHTPHPCSMSLWVLRMRGKSSIYRPQNAYGDICPKGSHKAITVTAAPNAIVVAEGPPTVFLSALGSTVEDRHNYWCIMLPFLHESPVWQTDRQTDGIAIAYARLQHMLSRAKIDCSWAFWDYCCL